jgi:hypothetical protein
MKIIFYTLLILLLSSSCSSNFELEKIDLPNNDTLKLVEVEEVFDSTKQTNSVFEGYEYANFKLNYFQTEGYSTRDRYWYEIIIVDSLLILNFNSPQNDDWNYISYQKQIILYEELENIKQVVDDAKTHQKTEGIPHWSDWSGSGYGENRLYIESEKFNIAGGMIYNCMGYGAEDSRSTIQKEKEESTTIGGDYELLFTELEKLFESLPFLMEDKDRKY